MNARSVSRIGIIGTNSEYMTFGNRNNFVHKGDFYDRDIYNGRCYRLEGSNSFHSRLGREGGMARRRISAALFSKLLDECEKLIAEATGYGEGARAG